MRRGALILFAALALLAAVATAAWAHGGGHATGATIRAAGPPAADVEVNAVGGPLRGPASYAEVRGTLDAHMHMMAFEMFGGRAFCGRPWDPRGVAFALRDCPDHYPNGGGAALENITSHGSPVGFHDPVGWPTFRDWPAHGSLTHQQSYYKWLERAWRGGLRVFVNLFVENRVLCEVYPYKQNSCDEMDSIRLQAHRLRELEAFIDAQHGGPGRGWFRIVSDPFQARRVIASGRLAVVPGIEVSEPFGCRVYNDRPLCDRAQIDRGLAEVYRLGVRQMELVNKFDNALAGVAGDSGQTGVVVNQGNKLSTGKYWQMERCTGPPEETDKPQVGTYDHDHSDLGAAILESSLPAGAAPIYPQGAHCNARGLTDLGEHLVRRMMASGMIVDPDHLSVRARKGVMALLEAERYSGVVSSHSWSTIDVIPRIYRLGGVVTPISTDSAEFASEWRKIRRQRSGRFFHGFGYGADANGLHKQPGPRRGPNPVRYPFRSFDGGTVFHRQRSGQRIFDINQDGVAHYGLYPDWLEDLRNVAGPAIVRDMARGAESYLQMWERSVGIPGPNCRSPHFHWTHRGLSYLRIGWRPDRLLRRGGQPQARGPRAWRWCIRGRENRRNKLVTVLTRRREVGLVVTNARSRRKLSNKTPVRRLRQQLRGRIRRVGRNLFIRRIQHGRLVVYGFSRGRVRYVAVAARSVGKNRRTLRRYLRLARVGPRR